MPRDWSENTTRFYSKFQIDLPYTTQNEQHDVELLVVYINTLNQSILQYTEKMTILTAYSRLSRFLMMVGKFSSIPPQAKCDKIDILRPRRAEILLAFQQGSRFRINLLKLLRKMSLGKATFFLRQISKI